MYFYNAGYYAPYLNRWIQPDTIVSDFQNPQSLNRCSYVYNNPLKYADQDGHFPIPLITGGVGALVGGALDLGKRLVVDHKSIRIVNWAEVAGAAGGGFVAGATMGLAPAGTSTLGVAALGGLGSAVGGQVQALTQAGFEGLLGNNPQASVVEQAMDLGLLDPTTIAVDAGVGMVMGTVGDKFGGWLRSELALPESASTISSSGELPMVRWQISVDQPGRWTIQTEGRVLNIDATTFEKIARSFVIGFYDIAEETLMEAMGQGLAEGIGEIIQP